MKIIKRSGQEAQFDRQKIIAAVTKANNEVNARKRLSAEQIEKIGLNVEEYAAKRKRALGVEEIQDIVENEIMDLKAFEVAR
ncbi:MAG: anaerobic ribonucleoside-triphosphate reductase, partial [Clostridia bacterium]|nr:anaerobic ribonucleoside-triphosphate reductase [Clostridia bacterium]